MKLKLRDKVNLLLRRTLFGVLLQCLVLNLLWAADMNSFETKRNTEESEVNQGISITGKVLSEEDNTGIPGVNILVKGTSTGTVTDIDGNYSIEVPNQNASIVFSAVGFVSEEIAVGTRSVIDLTLKVDFTSLEEIIVVGYGEQKKATVTGAVASVDGEIVREFPTNNLSLKKPI